MFRFFKRRNRNRDMEPVVDYRIPDLDTTTVWVSIPVTAAEVRRIEDLFAQARPVIHRYAYDEAGQRIVRELHVGLGATTYGTGTEPVAELDEADLRHLEAARDALRPNQRDDYRELFAVLWQRLGAVRAEADPDEVLELDGSTINTAAMAAAGPERSAEVEWLHTNLREARDDLRRGNRTRARQVLDAMFAEAADRDAFRAVVRAYLDDTDPTR